MRHGVFVHDPDGDMGYGVIVGPYRTGDRADTEARRIESAARLMGVNVECIVVPVLGAADHKPGEVLAKVFE